MAISKKLTGTLVAVSLATAGYWYWSPILALKAMRDAAYASDAIRFNNYVDYPKLRENLKGVLAARVTKDLPSDGDSSGFGALGMSLGLMMVGGIVDSLVRPEMVMQMMTQGKMQAKADPQGAKTPPDIKWKSERPTMSMYVVHVLDPNTGATQLSVTMERSGFADWKLTQLNPSFDN